MGKTAQGNRPGRGAVRERRSAALSSEFGMGMLRKRWPEHADEILAELGVYSRGPRKGLPRGYVHWTKVVEGGFDYGARCVVWPGTYDWRVLRDSDGDSESVSGPIVRRHEAAANAARSAREEAERVALREAEAEAEVERLIADHKGNEADLLGYARHFRDRARIVRREARDAGVSHALVDEIVSDNMARAKLAIKAVRRVRAAGVH